MASYPCSAHCKMLRGQLAQAQTEIAQLKREVTELTMLLAMEHNLEDQWGEVCKSCLGVGRRGYPDTSTWRGGMAGQTFTIGVCDTCWGSGSSNRPWKSWREIEADLHRVETGTQEKKHDIPENR